MSAPSSCQSVVDAALSIKMIEPQSVNGPKLVLRVGL